MAADHRVGVGLGETNAWPTATTNWQMAATWAGCGGGRQPAAGGHQLDQPGGLWVAQPPARSACAPPPSARRNARRPTRPSGPGTVRRCSPTGRPTRGWSGETSRSTAGAASASLVLLPATPRPRAAHVIRARDRRRPPGQLGFRCQCSTQLTHSKKSAGSLASRPKPRVSATVALPALGGCGFELAVAPRGGGSGARRRREEENVRVRRHLGRRMASGRRGHR